jgi:integrase
MDGKRSHYVSKSFGDHLRKRGFPDELTFHSLRRSFAQRCDLAGIPPTTAAQLLGHHRRGLSYGLYSPGVDFPKLGGEPLDRSKPKARAYESAVELELFTDWESLVDAIVFAADSPEL